MKTVLVTGANKGIGLEICRQLGEKNFHVILSARNKDRGLAAIQDLNRQSIDAEFIEMDDSKEESVISALINLKKQIIFYPQTYGPYFSSLVKIYVKAMLKKAKLLYSRDAEGIVFLKKELPIMKTSTPRLNTKGI